MVKRFERVFIYEEDKRIAKSKAGLLGIPMADYLGSKIREDSDDIKSYLLELERKKKSTERKYFDFFKK